MDKLRWVIPHKAYILNIVIKMIMVDGRYDPFLAMEDLSCDSVFVGDILGKVLIAMKILNM